jgi:hypothetical protein
MKVAGKNKEHSVVFKVSGIQFEEILARKVGFENVALWSLEAVHLLTAAGLPWQAIG